MSGSIQCKTCNGYIKQQPQVIEGNKIRWYKNEGRQLTLIASANGKRRLVTTTPKLNTSMSCHQKTFDNWAGQELGGLADQIEHMSMGKKNINGEDDAVESFLEFMRKRYPKTFDSYIEKSGLKSKIKRMTAVETGAVTTDVGLSGRQLEKLEHHIRFHLGSPIFCPRDDLRTLTDDCPDPTIFSKDIRHKDQSLEKIYVLMHDLENYICAEMNRELGTTYKSLRRSMTDPMFSYSLLSSKVRKGIYTLLGTDHGQDFCQFAICLLLGTPEDRRRAGCPDYQTKTINFCTIKCKKDLHEILKITKDNVDKALNALRNKCMVAIEDHRGRTKTLFVDSGLEIVRVRKDVTESDSCILMCRGETGEVEIKTTTEGLDTNAPLKHFMVIQGFHNFQCGDYAAQFTLQGRHGMSSSRCMHCNLTHAEWNEEGGCITKQHLLTFKDIENGNNDDVGNTDKPTYGYDPLDCLGPILHGEIGTGNKQIDSSLIPLLIDVDSATDEEYAKLSQQHELDCELISLDGKIGDYGGISKNEQINDMKKSRAVLKKNLRLTRQRLKRRQESTKDMTNRDERIKECSEQIAKIDREVEKMNGEIDQLEKKHKSGKELLREKRAVVKGKIKTIRKEIEQLLSQWKKKGESLVSTFHRTLEEYNITVRAWHGGSLIGRHVISLFRNGKEIIEKLKKECLDRAEERRQTGEESETRRIPKDEDIVNHLNKQRNLFEVQDYVYSSLRLIHPTDEECDMTECFVDDMKRQWREMGLSTTCKMHFNYNHVCVQQRRVGGFGDKSEDWLEREHQQQMRWNRITLGMSPKAALKCQAKLKWRAGNPLIREQILRVKASINRKLKGSDELNVIELEEAATKINKSWREKYGGRRKLMTKYVACQGALCRNVNS